MSVPTHEKRALLGEARPALIGARESSLVGDIDTALTPGGSDDGR